MRDLASFDEPATADRQNSRPAGIDERTAPLEMAQTLARERIILVLRKKSVPALIACLGEQLAISVHNCPLLADSRFPMSIADSDVLVDLGSISRTCAGCVSCKETASSLSSSPKVQARYRTSRPAACTAGSGPNRKGTSAPVLIPDGGEILGHALLARDPDLVEHRARDDELEGLITRAESSPTASAAATRCAAIRACAVI